ncbi:MAG: hypothetical protein A2Y17_10860 [Clostridiales bacterium GWF2_38_85]|nr:MAG: hypothetical protein A2Y17_10860 [Clostridiales bacterium GWF2_38_85]
MCAFLSGGIFSGCEPANNTSETSNTPSTISETSVVEKVELPFTPIERPTLLADSMPAICEPKVSGDFIQAWLCNNWSKFEWSLYLNQLKKAGFEFVIMQYTTGRENAKYTEFLYPTEMANDLSISAADCNVYPTGVENLLKSAKKAGLKVYIGIGGDSDWWNYEFEDIEWCKREANFTNRCIQELYDLYKEDYPDTFAGWYWAWEMFSAKGNHEVNWSEMISINLDYMTQLDPSMPCIFSPFFSSYEDVSVERVLEEYTYLMEHTSFRKGDIFCPQDNIGIHSTEYGDANNNKGKYPITFMEQVVRALKEATEKNPKVRFWLNIENFNGPNGKSATLNRYVDQMNIASKYAEKLITFSYAHYYSPSQVGKEYNLQYLQYLEWLKQNPQTNNILN